LFNDVGGSIYIGAIVVGQTAEDSPVPLKEGISSVAE
jgi:hypothetical protein